jgi:nicotinamide mononucleotide transporter
MPHALDWAAPLLAAAFTLWDYPVTWVEIVAFVLSIWMVERNMRVDPLAWPLAITASLLYALLFAAHRLYGEAGLQFVFIGVALWGWHQWLRGRGDDGSALRVHRLTASGRWRVAILTLLTWPLLGLLLDQATDSDVPYFDALPTIGSVTGQLLLGRKLIENWIVWFGVNIVSVALFAWKGLWLTVLLYAIFTGLSWLGWRTWRRQLGPAMP